MKQNTHPLASLAWLIAASLMATMLAGCGPSFTAPGTSTPLPALPEASSGPAVPASPGPTLATIALAPTFTPEALARVTPTPPDKTADRTPILEATPTRPEKTPEVTPTSGSPVASSVPTKPAQTATVVPQVPSPTALPPPQVLSFHVTPTTTLNLGDSLTLSWKAVGERAELCPISGPGPVELRCQEVPLLGSTEFVTDEEAMAYDGLGLRVSAGDASIWSVVYLHLQCQNLRPWFFEEPPPRCPADVAHESYAAGQYFERGLMIWVEDPDDFYVFYRGKDQQGFQTFDWVLDITLKPGASETNRVGEEPPPGRYEPVSGFGLVWRGEIEGVRPDVHQRLGWATGPEFGFDTAYQCMTPSHPRLWNCFLRGPRGEILHLHPDSTAQVRFLWEEQ